jgi:hypothetical protein
MQSVAIAQNLELGCCIQDCWPVYATSGSSWGADQFLFWSCSRCPTFDKVCHAIEQGFVVQNEKQTSSAVLATGTINKAND